LEKEMLVVTRFFPNLTDIPSLPLDVWYFSEHVSLYTIGNIRDNPYHLSPNAHKIENLILKNNPKSRFSNSSSCLTHFPVSHIEKNVCISYPRYVVHNFKKFCELSIHDLGSANQRK